MVDVSVAPAHVIPKLKSSFLTTLIFAYAYNFNGAVATIKKLSRKGG